MRPRLNVLHLLAPAPFGGLESVVSALAVGERDAGVNVHVALVTSVGAVEPSISHALKASGIPIHPIEVRTRDYRTERRATKSLLRKLGISLFHSHGYRPDVLDIPVARGAGVATVSTVHGFTAMDLKARIYEWFQKRALRRCHAVLAVAEPQVEVLRNAGVPGESIHVVPNAWRPSGLGQSRAEARSILGVPPGDEPLIGFVGRVSHEKGLDVLVQALATPALRDARVCVVGSGPDEADLRRSLHRSGLAKRVHWAGSVGDASRLMAAFDLLALPSRTEGTPMVVLEATGAGVPVVGTRVGNVPLLLGDGGNVVPSEDPATFAAAIASVLESPRLRERLVETARLAVNQHCGFDGWIDRHLDIYQHVLDRAPVGTDETSSPSFTPTNQAI